MATQFVKISRTNGETFYFNLDHVTMVFDNPLDKKVVVTGTGFEKNFRPDEARELLTVISAFTVTVEMPPEAVPTEDPATDAS